MQPPSASPPPTRHRQLHALGPHERGCDVLQLQGGHAVQLLVDALENMIVQVPRLQCGELQELQWGSLLYNLFLMSLQMLQQSPPPVFLSLRPPPPSPSPPPPAASPRTWCSSASLRLALYFSSQSYASVSSLG